MGLALFRNFQGIMPWDHDVDFILGVDGPEDDVVPGGIFSYLLEHPAQEQDGEGDPPVIADLRKLGFSWKVLGDYRIKGAGIHLEMHFMTGMFSPGPRSVTLDAIAKADYNLATWPLSVDLAGVEVRISWDLVDYIVGKFSTSSDKRLQGGTFWGAMHPDMSLTCREPGHNACLPNCTLREPEQLCASSPQCATSEPWCNECIAAPVATCEFPDRMVEIDYFGG